MKLVVVGHTTTKDKLGNESRELQVMKLRHVSNGACKDCSRERQNGSSRCEKHSLKK